MMSENQIPAAADPTDGPVPEPEGAVTRSQGAHADPAGTNAEPSADLTYSFESSILVEASPGDVHALVSDVTRTGEWSVQTHLCEWEDEARGPGARFTGHNRTDEREWQTVSTVIADEPGREFAWTIGDAGVVWGYRMTPEASGTRLIQFTDFPETAVRFFHDRHGEDAERQIGIRREAARTGIPETLEKIAVILR